MKSDYYASIEDKRDKAKLCDMGDTIQQREYLIYINCTAWRVFYYREYYCRILHFAITTCRCRSS